MAELASRDINLYVNAVSRTMTSKGVTKQITDDFWASDIAPILHPMWDSDRDRMESFARYADGFTVINKIKYQRDRKTGDYKWVSYELSLEGIEQSELDSLYERLDAKYTEFRGIIDQDLEQQLAVTFAKDHIITWTKILMVRKFLLDESDYTQMADYTGSDEDKAMWVTYRQKLRDLPEDQQGLPTNSVRFPINPTKYKLMVDEERTTADYLTDLEGHYYNISRSVLHKFASKMVAYLTIAIQSGNIDEMPNLQPAKTEANTLDAILEVIEQGGFD